MPSFPATACAQPRCPLPAVRGGRGRCAQHVHLVSTTNRGYGAAWRKLSVAMRERAGYRCSMCDVVNTKPFELHVDHIIPRSAGGSDDPSNLRVLCRVCHAKYGRQGTVRGW